MITVNARGAGLVQIQFMLSALCTSYIRTVSHTSRTLFVKLQRRSLHNMASETTDKLPGMPHGFVLGTASNGVIGYNCNYQHILPGDKSYDQLNYVKDARGKLQYSGDKWQCVEYARRTWITELDVYLPNTPRACDIWDRLFVKRLSDNARVSLLKYTSGVTHHRPAVNDLIIWKKTDEQPYGHVAVVSEVTDHRIRIAEQNADNDVLWTHGHFSREFKLSHDSTSGAWTMHDEEDPLFGWVRVDLENVADALPWSQPEEDVTGVDGQYGPSSAKCLQKFLGTRVDGEHGRATDMALAAFLNTRYQEYEHVDVPFYMAPFDRAILIRKLQAFALAYSSMTNANEHGVVINGEWDSPTIMAVQTLLNRVQHADDFEAAAIVYKNGGPPPRPNLLHGTVLGTAPSGIIAYNCNYDNFPEPTEEEHFDMLTYVKDSRGELTYSGMKWQCVEYARRWWISQLDVYLMNVPRACDIWTRTFVKRLSDNARVALQMHDNGVSTSRPAVDDLLIWIKTDEQPVGHVAVVCEVTDEYVCIAEQNVDNNKMWSGGHYSRKFALQRHEETGAWTIRDDEDPMFGWVRCLKDVVVPTPPCGKTETERFPVDGVLEGDSLTAYQVFVGLDVKRDFANMDLSSPWIANMIRRMTDYALAAFLNTVHHSYAHVPMHFFRSPHYTNEPLIKKLQSFLNTYPELSGAGGQNGLVIELTGAMDEPTVKGLQNLLNKVDHSEFFLEAVAAYRS